MEFWEIAATVPASAGFKSSVVFWSAAALPIERLPAAIRVVSREKYEEWLAESKKKFAAAQTPVRMAAGESIR